MSSKSTMFGSNFCEDQRPPFELSVTTTVISAILCVITMPGNMLICWAIIRDPNRELKSSFNYLVLNLAIADLVTGLITEPSFVVFHIRESHGNKVMNGMSPAMVHVPYFVSCTASVLSISALAIERYLSVTSKYRRSYTRSKTVISSVMIWVFSIAVSSIYFATGFYTFLFVFANVIVVTTLVVITCAYSRIYKSLRVHGERGVTTNNDHIMKNRLKYEKKATRSFLLVLFIFICCNLSSCAMVYVILLCSECSCYVIHWLRDLQFLMALVNCAANQFLYAWRMPSFTRAFRLILPCPVGSVMSGRVGNVSNYLQMSSSAAHNNQHSTDRSVCAADGLDNGVHFCPTVRKSSQRNDVQTH